MFPCKKCGRCCRRVGNTLFGKALALPNGVCRHLDESTNLCRIYEERPLFCNIDKAYEECYKDLMTQQEYYQRNLEICHRLQSE